MQERTIQLPEELDRFVEASVTSGRYGDASEVMTEALRLLETSEEDVRQLEALREAVQVGFDDLDQGRSRTVPDDQLEDFVAQVGAAAAERVRGRRNG